MMRRFLLPMLLTVFSCVWLSGCDWDGSDDDDDDETSTAQIRLVNLTSVNDLLLTVDDGDDDETLISAVSSGAASDYQKLDIDTYSLVISSAAGNLSASATGSLTPVEDTDYTVVAYERGGLIKFFTRTDDIDEPSSGFAYLTVVNASSDAGSLDVYIVEPGEDIGDLTPSFSSVGAASSSLTNAISAGNYDLVVTAANKPGDVRLKLSSVALANGDILSFALTSTTGGALVDGALIQQGGSVAIHRANKARVRVVAAFAAGESSNWAVRSSVAGVNLATVTAPSIGNYELVAADTTDYQVMVGDTAVEFLPDAEFASGGDYTLLVYGTDDTDAEVTVLTDSNQLPSSGAKMRLINGAVVTAGLSLSANYSNLFSEVWYGSSSAYSGISAGTTRLDLTSPALAFTSYSSSINMLSGGVYSLFVLGNTESAIVLLNKDR